MTKQELCELTVTEVAALIKIAAAGLAKHDMKVSEAMRGSAAALEKRKTDIAKNIVESIGGE